MSKDDKGKREIKFDMTKLVELPKANVDVIKAPPVYDRRKEKEDRMKGLVEFDLRKEFD